MGNGILDSSKYTVHPHKSPALRSLHLLSLLLTSVIIGVLGVVLVKTPSLAKSSQAPIEHTFVTIPKATIAYADTIGSNTTPTPTTTPERPLTSDQLYAQNPEAVTTTTPDPSATPSAALNADLIFSMINQIREQNSLPTFLKDERLCSLATSRAPEVHHEVVTGTMHQGMYARHLPYWNNENIIDIRSEEEAVHWWMSDYVHKAAILGNYQFSCVACSGDACAEEFSNFEEK